MDIQVSGKNIDLGESLQNHVSERLADGVNKYFGRGGDAVVTFSRERHLVACEMTAHLVSGVVLAASGEGGDAYGAFEDALEKLEKRVRRHKRRLKNHHANGKDFGPTKSASYTVLAPLPEEIEDESDANGSIEHAPVVVAEHKSAVREMTVGSAVMQLDLADAPAIVFKNAAHGRLNVVYRRPDGNIGWIDPAP